MKLPFLIVKRVNKINLPWKDIFELYKIEIYSLYGMITFL